MAAASGNSRNDKQLTVVVNTRTGALRKIPHALRGRRGTVRVTVVNTGDDWWAPNRRSKRARVAL